MSQQVLDIRSGLYEWRFGQAQWHVKVQFQCALQGFVHTLPGKAKLGHARHASRCETQVFDDCNACGCLISCAMTERRLTHTRGHNSMERVSSALVRQEPTEGLHGAAGRSRGDWNATRGFDLERHVGRET